MVHVLAREVKSRFCCAPVVLVLALHEGSKFSLHTVDRPRIEHKHKR